MFDDFHHADTFSQHESGHESSSHEHLASAAIQLDRHLRFWPSGAENSYPAKSYRA
jgi:hypothetical protein